VKPSSFDELARLIKILHEYWELGIKPNADMAA